MCVCVYERCSLSQQAFVFAQDLLTKRIFFSFSMDAHSHTLASLAGICFFKQTILYNFFLYLSPISSWSLCVACFLLVFVSLSQLSSGCKCSRLKNLPYVFLAFINSCYCYNSQETHTRTETLSITYGIAKLLLVCFLYVYLFVLNLYGNFDFFYYTNVHSFFVCSFLLFRLMLICYFVVAP